MGHELRSVAGPRARLFGALVVGLLAGAALMAVCESPLHSARAAAASATPPPSRSQAPPASASPPPQAALPGTEAPELTARERLVLARLAQLPDLPVVQTPAFDVKVMEAAARTAVSAKTAARAVSAGESVIARIQVVSVERGRVFYRSVDEQMHTARVGERLLGVNGRVVGIDEHGADLQIDGQRMRVAANSL
jgi:hypothetical protein